MVSGFCDHVLGVPCQCDSQVVLSGFDFVCRPPQKPSSVFPTASVTGDDASQLVGRRMSGGSEVGGVRPALQAASPAMLLSSLQRGRQESASQIRLREKQSCVLDRECAERAESAVLLSLQ